MASDFYAQEAVVFSSGPLRQAIAASMALPVLFQPVQIDGRVLIDGGLVNPLPFDLIAGEADLTVAVDASGAPTRRAGQATPKAWEALFASNFIFERTIIREKLRHRHPDLYIDAGTSRFQILDFLKIDEILAAAEPAKERVKAQLARMLEAETLRPVEAPSRPRSLPRRASRPGGRCCGGCAPSNPSARPEEHGRTAVYGAKLGHGTCNCRRRFGGQGCNHSQGGENGSQRAYPGAHGSRRIGRQARGHRRSSGRQPAEAHEVRPGIRRRAPLSRLRPDRSRGARQGAASTFPPIRFMQTWH